MNRRKQTPIRFLALVMAIATITSFSFRWFVIKTPAPSAAGRNDWMKDYTL